MTGDVGRPPKPQSFLEALPPDKKEVGDMLKVKALQMRADPIMVAADNGPDSPELLGEVMKGMTEEIASLRFERMQAERKGQDTSTISMRRIQGLKAVGDHWIKLKEQIQSRAIDLDSPEFANLLAFIGETFQISLDEAGVSPNLSKSVFNIFGKKLDDDTWKNEARSKMKGA